jgi:hypothetical protein
MKIDKNDAPPGYIAVEADHKGYCSGCAFENNKHCITINQACYGSRRKDGCMVIFVKISSAPMMRSEFKDAMETIQTNYGADPEMAHSHMDALMGDLLFSLGYGDGVEIFRAQRKWYS